MACSNPDIMPGATREEVLARLASVGPAPKQTSLLNQWVMAREAYTEVLLERWPGEPANGEAK